MAISSLYFDRSQATKNRNKFNKQRAKEICENIIPIIEEKSKMGHSKLYIDLFEYCSDKEASGKQILEIERLIEVLGFSIRTKYYLNSRSQTSKYKCHVISW